MSEQLSLMLDIVSKLTSQLPVQITQHKIEGVCKEGKETGFGNNISHFV